MSTGIRVNCRRCGTECDSSQRREDGLCLVCFAQDQVAGLLAEWSRYDAQRERYLARGLRVGNIESRSTRVVKRISGRLQRLLGTEAGIRLQQELIAAAHNRVLGATRIRIDHAGDLVGVR